MGIKISKWGNSLGLRIPKEAIRALDWTEGREVELNVADGILSVRPAVPESRRRTRSESVESLLSETKHHRPGKILPNMIRTPKR